MNTPFLVLGLPSATPPPATAPPATATAPDPSLSPVLPPDPRFSPALQELLECVVCKEPCASPIYTCVQNGHLTCGLCFDRLTPPEPNHAVLCPLCRAPQLAVNPLAERLSRNYDMEASCPFASSGCDLPRLLAAEKKPHVLNCEYRDVECTTDRLQNPETADDPATQPCRRPFALAEFPRHLVTTHGKPVITNGAQLSISFPRPLSLNDVESLTWWKKQAQFLPTTNVFIYFDDLYFSIQGATDNYIFKWWVTVFAGQKDADRYSFETHIVPKTAGEEDPDLPTTWKFPVMPFNKSEKYEPCCGNYGLAHGMTIASNAEQDPTTNKWSFDVSLKISKKIPDIEGTETPEADALVDPQGERRGTKRKAEEIEPEPEFEMEE